MSYFKSEQQRDERRFTSWLKGFFLGRECPSYIAIPSNKIPWVCELKQGHAGEHTAFVGKPNQIWWGYGDNWLEGC